MANAEKDIWEVNSEVMANQALLIGLMRALRNSSDGQKIISQAFDFAEDSATAGAMSIKSSKVKDTGRRQLEILGQLRKIVL